jgi:hypothetical protein
VHFILIENRTQPLMSRHVRTFKRRKAFLDMLEVGMSISRAADAAGATTQFFKSWRNSDEDFAKDWDEAIETGTDYIEDTATQRALEKSDPLMMMMLKARRPEKFDRGSRLELTGNINVEGSKAKLLNRLARLQAASQQAIEEIKEEAGEEESKGGGETKALQAPAAGITRGRRDRGKVKSR